MWSSHDRVYVLTMMDSPLIHHLFSATGHSGPTEEQMVGVAAESLSDLSAQRHPPRLMVLRIPGWRSRTSLGRRWPNGGVLG